MANTNSVVRFPYTSGDTRATGKPETVIAALPEGGHSTRDVVFSNDGRQMMVSVGSGSNVGQGMGSPSGGLPSWIGQQPLGASWGYENNRAGVLTFDPDGKNASVFATGIRNCVGLAVHPLTGDLYCSTNERDGLGDNLVPDYVTRVRQGAFYGWPWFYIGDNQDPRHPGARADLKGKITIPDVLIQPHSASLGLAFYNGDAFPAEYRGDGFAAEHGSWNRSKRTGYKVIRIRLKDGVPSGEYEDFVTGFVVNDSLNVSRFEFDRLKAILHNCAKHGPASQNRDNLPHFAEHLRGRIAHVQHLNPARGAKLLAIFQTIAWPAPT